MIETFADGTKLISGDDFKEWAKKVIALPDGKKMGCAQCVHADRDDGYCSDCSHTWHHQSCSCHINPPCSVCSNNLFEEKE